jgi:hypothetical protein
MTVRDGQSAKEPSAERKFGKWQRTEWHSSELHRTQKKGTEPMNILLNEN